MRNDTEWGDGDGGEKYLKKIYNIFFLIKATTSWAAWQLSNDNQ